MAINKDPLEELLEWAREGGLEMNGIEARRLPGRGIGIVATQNLKPGDILLNIPTRLLRTASAVPRSISRRLPKDMTVHGLLAADLALDRTDKHAAWNAVVPSPTDTLGSMPLAWPPALQALLPRGAAALLAKQQAKLARDWAAAHAAFPEVGEEEYLHAWLLVNTRTFYYHVAGPARARDDCMALVPVADLFNHSGAGGECAVTFGDDGFTIAAGEMVAKGDEVFVAYGRHGGDFLLAEYGFVMGGNAWDEACIDDAVLSALSSKQRKQLEGAGFLGEYKVDAGEVCYRTQVAVRAMCLPVGKWRRFVEGLDDGEVEDEEVDRILAGLLRTYSETVKQTIMKLEKLKAGEEVQRQMLQNRWLQIQALLALTIKRLES